MTQRINFSQANNSGKQVAQTVNRVLETLADLRRTGAMLDMLTYDSDWAAAAGELGLVDQTGYTKEQQAQDLWTLVVTARNAMDVDQVRSLSRLDQW